ncbi:peroxiredoxin [bacterium]|nr:peroxiredoxin [candidate division CSSED10-310 bacterium]
MKAVLMSVGFLFLGLSGSAAVQPGDPAPDFRLPDSEGKNHALSDYAGKTVAIYFYPKDNTPGCTSQACSIRDGFAELEQKGIIVLGVSYDDVASHAAFRKKHGLNFTLLADTDRVAARAYGADGMLFARRMTFIIGPDGRILAVIDKVDTRDHARQILDALKQEGK